MYRWTKILFPTCSTTHRIVHQSFHSTRNQLLVQTANQFIFVVHDQFVDIKRSIRDTEIKSNHALVIPFPTLERLNQSNTHANTDCRLNHPLCSTIGTLFTCTFTHELATLHWHELGGTGRHRTFTHGDTRTVQVFQGVGDEHWSWINVVQWNKSDYYFSLLNQPNSTTRTTTTATCCQGTSTPLTLQAQARKANKRQSLFVDTHTAIHLSHWLLNELVAVCLFFPLIFSFLFVFCVGDVHSFTRPTRAAKWLIPRNPAVRHLFAISLLNNGVE